MDQTELNKSWKNWLKENLANNCAPQELYDILRNNGFADESIEKEMGEDYPPSWETSSNCTKERYNTFATTRITRPDNGMHVLKVNTEKLQIYIVDNFLSEEECDEIVATVKPHLRPSTVTRENEDKAYRTSSTSDMILMKAPTERKIVAALDEKISRTIGIRLPYSEGIQAQQYLVGQEFKQHTDFFQPGTDEYKQYAGKRGQRTWTVTVCLNKVLEGGGTKFFALDKVFLPQKGRAVIWNNLHPDGTGNKATIHAGLPVVKGEKIIITKWFRSNGSGPLLYDEE